MNFTTWFGHLIMHSCICGLHCFRKVKQHVTSTANSIIYSQQSTFLYWGLCTEGGAPNVCQHSHGHLILVQTNNPLQGRGQVCVQELHKLIQYLRVSYLLTYLLTYFFSFFLCVSGISFAMLWMPQRMMWWYLLGVVVQEQCTNSSMVLTSPTVTSQALLYDILH